MEPNADEPPLLRPDLQTSVSRRRRSMTPPFLSPPVLIIILPLAVLFLFLFAVPSFLSITSQIIRPNLVKKSWDSLNVFLVLFAILCGVFAKRNDDGSSQPPSPYGEDNRTVKNVMLNAGVDSKPPSVSQQWFGDLYDVERLKIYESVSGGTASSGLPATGTGRLRRSISSYPDLRQGASCETGDHQFRFYDDFEINKYRSQAVTSDDHAQFQRRRIQIEVLEDKEIPVDTFEVRSTSLRRHPPAPTPSPPPPPPADVKPKPKQTYHSVEIKEKRVKAIESTDGDSTNIKRAPLPPTPPPTPLPARTTHESERKQGRTTERRKKNATKEIKTVLASLYNQRKRKRKLQKSKTKSESFDNHKPIVRDQTNYCSGIQPPSPPPLPPPPRPSQSVLYGLFKKGSKSKKVHSVAAPPPPPPPPPSTRSSQRKIQMVPPSAPPPPPPAPATPPRRRPGRPPLPTKPTGSYEENLNGGSQSPLIPRPPPPPFKMPEMKFVFRGDFAKIRSNQSSRGSSPNRGEIDLGLGIDEPDKVTGISPDGGDNSSGIVGTEPAFCPSPDVNTKADSFIARLRDEWRLERMNSAREKRKTGAVSGPFGFPT